MPLDQLVAADIEHQPIAGNRVDLAGRDVTVRREQPVGVDADEALVDQALAQLFRQLVDRKGLGEVIDQRVVAFAQVAVADGFDLGRFRVVLAELNILDLADFVMLTSNTFIPSSTNLSVLGVCIGLLLSLAAGAVSKEE